MRFSTKLMLAGTAAFLYSATVWAAPNVIGTFEPGENPVAVSPFGYTGGAGGKQLKGGSTDPVFGTVPQAAQGSNVYGVNWKDPGEDATVEVKCEFAPPFDVTGVESILLDMYVPKGTDPAMGLGIWFTDAKVWVPESNAVGANDKWVTMKVALPGVSGSVKELNLGFKNVKGAGTVFFDNMRAVKKGDSGGTLPSSSTTTGSKGGGSADTSGGSAAIQWKTDLNAARDAAKTANKKLLLFFSASGSEPAQQQGQSFDDQKVASYVNEQYVPVKIDMVDQAQLAYQLGVFKAGTVVAYSSTGAPLGMIKQSLSPEDLLKQLSKW